MTDPKPDVRITPAIRCAWMRFLMDIAGNKPFRRSALSKTLYPLTNPRSRQKADAIADKLIQMAAKAGEIIRHGHLHWMRAEKGRTLLSRRRVAEYPDKIDLRLTTHCPGKWVAVDLETGDVFIGSRAGWKRADRQHRKEAAKVVKK